MADDTSRIAKRYAQLRLKDISFNGEEHLHYCPQCRHIVPEGLPCKVCEKTRAQTSSSLPLLTKVSRRKTFNIILYTFLALVIVILSTMGFLDDIDTTLIVATVSGVLFLILLAVSPIIRKLIQRHIFDIRYIKDSDKELLAEYVDGINNLDGSSDDLVRTYLILKAIANVYDFSDCRQRRAKCLTYIVEKADANCIFESETLCDDSIYLREIIQYFDSLLKKNPMYITPRIIIYVLKKLYEARPEEIGTAEISIREHFEDYARRVYPELLSGK